MEKLIELLNEYEPYIQSDGTHTYNLWGNAYQGHSAIFPKELAESYIISARYGFIKWLVDNDKIDRERFYDKVGNIISDFDLKGKYEGASNEVIMLLSISETPIDDLILYLK